MKQRKIYRFIKAFLQASAANWTAGATVAIAAFTFVSIGVGIAQWNVLTRTVNEMRAERRPWVSISPTIASDLVRTVPINNTWDSRKGISFTLDLALKNTGQSPAMNARIVMQAESWGPADDPVEVQKTFCDAERKKPYMHSPESFTIFAGEAMTPVERTFTFDGNWLQAAAAKTGGAIVPELIGCIDYGFPGEPWHHQTGFIYRVIRSNEPFTMDASAVPKSNLTLVLDPRGGYAD